jgi:hypothetical protein
LPAQQRWRRPQRYSPAHHRRRPSCHKSTRSMQMMFAGLRLRQTRQRRVAGVRGRCFCWNERCTAKDARHSRLQSRSRLSCSGQGWRVCLRTESGHSYSVRIVGINPNAAGFYYTL